MEAVKRALKEKDYIEGLFWDFACLYQKPRTDSQDKAFGRSLDVMADVYASAIGTTALRLKEIPPRPKEFEGVVCLFGLEMQLKELIGQGQVKEAEETIRALLVRFGEIHENGVQVDSKQLPLGVDATVHFVTHDSARRARRDGEAARREDRDAVLQLCAGVDTFYNERSYDGRKGMKGLEDDNGRGWCVDSLCLPPAYPQNPLPVPSKLAAGAAWRDQ